MGRLTCEHCKADLKNIEPESSSYESFACVDTECSLRGKVVVHHHKDNTQMREEWRRWFGNSR